MGRKAIAWLVQVTNDRHFTQENLNRANKLKTQEKTESPLRAAQNNHVRKSYVKEKIDKSQQKSKYRLCG